MSAFGLSLSRRLQISWVALLVVSMMPAWFAVAARAQGKERSVEQPIVYRTIQVDGLSIFYREAGPKDAPTLLMLHGLPSSSRMFEPLFARLADRYHLVAPDYPGFGHSDWPDPKKFAYTFDHIAEVMSHFTEAIGLSRYTLYMQDYGGPVGFRMALAHPERVAALIVQDAVAHNEGLGANWKTRRAFWADRAPNESAVAGNHEVAACGQRSKRGTPRSGSLDRRILFSQPARTGGHSKRSVLRLPHQRRELSQMAGMDARETAEAAGDLGQV
jgi:pimeloyl-ACP methyl ester carboxylesterase